MHKTFRIALKDVLMNEVEMKKKKKNKGRNDMDKYFLHDNHFYFIDLNFLNPSQFFLKSVKQ